MALFVLPAHGQEAFPALSGRVVDGADIIDAQTETTLTQQLAAFEAQSSDQLVVATISSLNGRPLEEYANLLFRHWQLGQADENNGVLLLIAKNDRKIRIEVGYGLEGVLTDVLASLIINNVIVPKFRAGDFSGGIAEGANQIIKVLSGDAAGLKSSAKRNQSTGKKATKLDWSHLPIGIFILFFIWNALSAILARIFGKKIRAGHYRWLGMNFYYGSGSGGSSGSGGWSGGSFGGGFAVRQRRSVPHHFRRVRVLAKLLLRR